MKKFSKILILLLTVMVVMTAFTVTILAADGEAEANLDHGSVNVSAVMGTYSEAADQLVGSGWEVAVSKKGTTLTNGHALTRQGYMFVEIGQDGKEKFMVSTPSNNKGNFKPNSTSVAYDSWMADISLSRPTISVTEGEGEEATKYTTYKYNLEDYPYVVIDFDTCTPTGAYGTSSLYDFSLRMDKNGAASGNYTLVFPYTDFSSHLDTTPYAWQHVTVVSRFVYTLDDNGAIAEGHYENVYYINGEKVNEKALDGNSNITSIMIGQELKRLGFYNMRISNGVTSGTPLVDFTGYKEGDKSTWPGAVVDGEGNVTDYTSPMYWYKEQAALDNLNIHYFQDGWTPDTIAAELYNEETYQFPFGLARAKIGDVYYDDLNKALAAAEEGATIQILADMTEELKVEKKVVFEIAKAEGGTYETNFASDGYRVAYRGDTVYVLEITDADRVTILWDNCTCTCADKANHQDTCTCTCSDTREGYPGHVLAKQSDGLFEEFIEYPGNTEFKVDENGVFIELLGWSLTPGGEMVTIIPAGSTLTLYPVYKITYYDFMLTTPAGAVTYHNTADLNTVISDAPANSTVKILRDVYVTATVTIKKAITIDINGHKFVRTTVPEKYLAVDNGDGTYTKGELVAEATSVRADVNVFHFAKPSSTSTRTDVHITSSVPGGEIMTLRLGGYVLVNAAGEMVDYNLSALALNWSYVYYNDANEKKTENYYSRFCSVAAGSTYNIYIDANVGEYEDTITFYGNAFWYSENGNDKKKYSFYVDGGSWYFFGSTLVFDNRANVDIEFKDALVYTSQTFSRIDYQKNTSTTNYGKTLFINCDVITKAIGLGAPEATVDTALLEFRNCRLSFTGVSGNYVSSGTRYGIFALTDGTILAKIPNATSELYAKAPDGSSLMYTTGTFDYQGLVSYSFTFENGVPTLEFEKKTVSVSYTIRVVNNDTVAMIGDKQYTDINAALAAVKPGEVITLCKDIEGTVTLTDSVKFDTNIYAASGVSGTYFEINYTVPNRYKGTTENGILTVEPDLSLPVKVIWAPGTPFEKVENLYLGNVPEYPTEVRIGDKIYTISGWSYTAGGAAEALAAITEANVISGSDITLYPIYEVEQAAIEATTSAGVVTYHRANEFASLFKDLPTGSTIKLLADIDTNASISLGKAFTIDMNGFDIRRTVLHGNTYRYSTGETTDEVISTVASNTTMFSIASGFNLTIKSSKPGSELYIVNMKRESWVDADGNEVKFAAGDATTTYLATTTNVKFDMTLENISVYTTSIISQSFESGSGFNITINNCNLYRVFSSTSTSACLFYTASWHAGKIEVNDSFIYTGAGSFFLRQPTTGGSDGIKIIFNNCDIYSAKDGHTQVKRANEYLQFNNCRYWGWLASTTTAGQMYGTSFFKPYDNSSKNYIINSIPEGYMAISLTTTKDYVIPSSALMLKDANGYPTYSFDFQTVTASFTYVIVPNDAVAILGEKSYSDINAAIAAAKEGDIIVLTADVAEAVAITNIAFPYVFNTNGFSINFTLPYGYAATADGNTVTVDIDRTLPVEIIWAPGLPFGTTTSVTFGNIPEYTGGPVVGINGMIYTITGWSYTEGGEVADLLAITEADILANKAITLYPVYTTVKAIFSVTTAEGAVTYYEAADFAAAIAAAPAGSTLTLLADLDTNASSISIGKKFTIDMNGFDIRRVNYYGTTYLKGEDGAEDVVIEAETIKESSSGSRRTLFAPAKGCDFTITSSNPGSEIYVVTIKRDSWVNAAGEEVEFTLGVPTGTVLFSAGGTGFNFNMSNVTVYATSIINQSHKSGSGFYATITNCKLYRVFDNTKATNPTYSTSYPFLFVGSPNAGKIEFKDSFIYSNADAYFIRSESVSNIDVIFDNCDIYVTGGRSNSTPSALGKHQFVNCRYYGWDVSSTNAGSFSGTSLFYNASSNDLPAIVAAIPEGFKLIPVNVTKTWTLLTAANLQLDENGYPILSFGTKEVDLIFTYMVVPDTTVAVIGDTVYTDINAAIAAAKVDEIIILCNNIEGKITLERFDVTFNTTAYEAGVASGFYTINFTLPAGYKVNNVNGIITFEIDTTTPTTIIWAPGTKFETTTQVTFGNVPEYTGDTVIIDVNKIYTLFGWSYTEGGEAEEILAITGEQIGTTITLYPVIETEIFEILLNLANGEVVHYHTANYAEAFKAATNGAELVLYADLYVGSNIALAEGQKFTLDLNGYNFGRYTEKVNNYTATKDGDAYKKGTLIDTTTVGAGAGGYLFTIAKGSFNITIKSSRAGATLTNVHVEGERWYDGDTVVKTVVTKKQTAGMFAGRSAANAGVPIANCTINILGDGITFYVDVIFYGEWGGSTYNTINIDGGTFVRPVGTTDTRNGFFYVSRKGNVVNVKNATFYCNGSWFMRDGGSPPYYSYNKFTFENCDIISGNIYINDSTTDCTFNNCRIVGTFTASPKIAIFGEGTVTTEKSGIAGTTAGFTYQPKKSGAVYGAVTGTINNSGFFAALEFTSTSVNTEFIYEVVSVDECVKITWVDYEGYFVSENYVIHGGEIAVPTVKVPLGDGYRAITNLKKWTVVGTDDVLVFGGEAVLAPEIAEMTLIAVEPTAAEIEYTSYVTTAMFNMVYYSNFAYNVYVPKLDWVNVTKLGDTAPTNTVFINGVEYWVYTVFVPVSEGIDGQEVVFEYIIDGQQFTAKFKPSAIFYANTIIDDPAATDLEKKVVGNLVRYIDEAYDYLNKTTPIYQETLDAFYAKYTVEDYRAEYPDKNIFDKTVFGGKVHSVYTVIQDGKVSFVVEITKEAFDAGYQIAFDDLTGNPVVSNVIDTKDEDKDGDKEEVIRVAYATPTLPLRTHIMKAFTITLTDENGNAVYFDGVKATTNFSLAAYINLMPNVAITKALYEFGASVLDYNPIVQGSYDIESITLFGEDIRNYTIATNKNDAHLYRAATKLQVLIHNETGYWLEIVDMASADKSIVLKVVAKTGGEGFRASFTAGEMLFESEYANSMMPTVIEFFTEKFNLAKAQGQKTVEISAIDNFTKNVRDVYYKDFGAIGDGVTDDSAAIKAAHDFANDGKHIVYADKDAKYYIGIMSEAIKIKTDVHWGNAEFTIDDSIIGPNDADKKGTLYRSVDVFSITRDHSSVAFDATSDIVKALNANKGLAIDKTTITKIDLGLGYPVTLRVNNDNHKNYVRYGANADEGAKQYEVVLLDAEGNIDPSTPFMFNYEEVTGMTAYRTTDAAITVDGGIFTTIANQAPRVYTAYERGIKVARPNVTLQNVQHYVVGEGETGAPYGAFLSPNFAYNLLVADCVFTGHKQYNNAQGTGMGTYDISSSTSVNVTFLRCTQSNFFTKATRGDDVPFDKKVTTSGLWGIMGSSYSKNVTYDQCTLSRMDAHNGVWNVTIKDSTIIHLTIDGGGTVNVENTTYYNSRLFEIRNDYGNFWYGDANFKNIKVVVPTSVSRFDILKLNWQNHDFGYPTQLPTNVTVDNLSLYNNNVPVYLYNSDIVKKADYILADEAPVTVTKEDGTTETVMKPNVNKMPCVVNFTILNSTSCNFVLPNKKLTYFYDNTTYTFTDGTTVTYEEEKTTA